MSAIEEQEAIRRLRAGALLLYPTETVWGLGCDPRSDSGVERLLDLKGRIDGAGLILVIDSAHLVDAWIGDEAPEARVIRQKILARFWPGPLTVIINTNSFTQKLFAPGVFGESSSLALRFSSHPVSGRLAAGLGGAIISTSANPKGEAPPATEEEARSYFPNLDFVCDNSSTPSHSLPSTLLDVRSLPFRVLREGAIPAQVLLSKN